MAKKTIQRKETSINKHIFQDRDLLRESFKKQYDFVASNLEDEDSQEVRVLVYYGIGGMGKTTLCHKIKEEVKERNKDAVVVYYDFNDGQDIRTVLTKISNILKNEEQFVFTTFQYAMYQYCIKKGEDPKQPEVRKYIQDNKILKEAFDISNFIPGASTISEIISFAEDKVTALRDKAMKRKLSEIENASIEELRRALPGYFADGIRKGMEDRKHKVPFVLILDTYEMLVNEYEALGVPKSDDLWLRGDGGLLLDIPNILCVIAGRERLKWGEVDPDWDETSLVQADLDTFKENDIREFLNYYDVTDANIQLKIATITKGLPLHLDLCVDMYNRLREKHREIKEDDFDGTFQTLAERLLRYMSDEEQLILYLMACMGTWTNVSWEKFSSGVTKSNHLYIFNMLLYKKLLNFMFISHKNNGSYMMHQNMREILVVNCPKDLITSFLKVSGDIIESQSLFSDSCYQILFEKTKVIALCNDKMIFEQYTADIYQILLDYLDNFEFDRFVKIYSILKKEVEDQEDSLVYNQLLILGLNYLLKKAKYKEAKDEILQNESMEFTNEKLALDYKLTSSYLYYILGDDRKALELRQEVYDSRCRLYGEEDLSTIRAKYCLSASLSRMGRYQEAIEKGRKLLEDSMDPSWKFSMVELVYLNQLGDSYFKVGEYLKAKGIYERVYESRKEILGNNNNSTMIAQNHIADTLVNLGEIEKALEIYHEVYEIRKKIFSDEQTAHPDILIVSNNQGIALMLNGQIQEAFQVESNAYDQKKESLGNNVPATYGSLENMGICKYMKNDYITAREYFEKVYEIRKAKQGEFYPDTIIASYHILLCKLHLGEIDENQYGNEIVTISDSLKYNLAYTSKIEQKKCIPYFSLGRYYE